MSARDVTAELADALRGVLEHFDPYTAEGAYVAARQALARYDAERAAEKACDADTKDRGPTHVIRSRGAVFHAYSETDAHYVRDTVGGEIERIRDEPFASPARLCAICGEAEACDGCGGRCVRCARLSRECC